MAERHPFYFNGSSTAFSLRKMTDAQLASLRYQLRVAYAAVLNANGNGRLYTGGTNNVGQAISTEYTKVTNTQARDNNWLTGHPTTSGGTWSYDNYPNHANDWPTYPAVGSTTRSTTTFTQTRTSVNMPTDANCRDYGWLYWQGSTTSFNMRVLSAEADFVDTIITDTISEAISGDEVGTYRIATSTPGTGWVDKGVVFTNTIYSNATVSTYKLWVKTSGSDPGGGQNPIGWKSGGAPFMSRSTASTGDLVQNVLLPILHRRVANNSALNYNINGSGTTRGTMLDTRYSGSSTSQWFSDPTYYRSRTPSGGQSTNATYILKLA